MKNKSLRFKLFLLSTFLLFVSLIVGGVGYWSSHKTVNNYNKVAKWNLTNTRYVYEMISLSRNARLQAFQLAMPGISRQQGEENAQESEQIWQKYDEFVALYLKEEFGPGEEEIWKRLNATMEKVKGFSKQIIELYRKNPAEDSVERKQMIKIISSDLDALTPDVKKFSAEMLNYHEKSAQENTLIAEDAAQMGTTLSIVFILAGIAVGGLFATLFSNGLVKVLTSITNSLTEAGIQVGAGSTQIASSSQELSQATTEQAASLEQTAASIEEMNQMIAKNTDNAQKSSLTSKASRDSAVKGKETVEQMINSMGDINNANNGIMEQVNHSNTQMAEIVAVIGEITNKTKVINDIVFQTKLLSFNASVEAARAGEHGKGFAVVAEEVGNLAQMSGNAAQEISSMLEESMRKVEDIVNESKTSVARMVEEGKRKVDAGTKIAHECGQVLEEIVVTIETVSSMAEEISKASLEQAQGIGEITKAMHSLDQVTQQNSATAEQSASAAEQLSAQSGSLNTIVSELYMAVHGTTNMAAATAPAEKKREVRSAKVLPLKEKMKKPAPKMNERPVAVTKKVSGDAAPSYDDTRFTDV